MAHMTMTFMDPELRMDLVPPMGLISTMNRRPPLDFETPMNRGLRMDLGLPMARMT